MTMFPADNADETIEDAAALWLADREAGFSPEQARAFECWYKTDPRHRVAFDRMEQTAALLERLPFARKKVEHLKEGAAKNPLPSRGWWRRHGRTRAAVAAGVVLTAIVGWQWLRPAVPEPVRYMTSAGGYERVRLEDGSTLELNASSEAQVRFTAGERHVTLIRGEAHFSVTRDSQRPFVVAAETVKVRAVGTAFNVRLASAKVAVLVTEGQVRVERRASREADRSWKKLETATATLLAASERTEIPVTADNRDVPLVVEHVSSEVVREALAWQERTLVFAETPMREVAAQFNRRNRVQLIIEDDELAGRPVGGSFAADNVAAFVHLFEESHDIVAERRGDQVIVLRKAR